MPTVIASPATGPERQVELDFSNMTITTIFSGVAKIQTQGLLFKEMHFMNTYWRNVIGNGSFGVVHLAKMKSSGEMVAIKKVLQDRRFKLRELQIMRDLNHKNVVQLKFFFYSAGVNDAELFRALAYIHSLGWLNSFFSFFLLFALFPEKKIYFVAALCTAGVSVRAHFNSIIYAVADRRFSGICHRDIKPQNLLVDPVTSVLKLCDFGSAKYMVNGESNLSYICSRYYRAPELMFGSNNYTCSVDVWSAGAVLAELLYGRPVFSGRCGLEQLIAVIRVLGTPSKNEILEMNPQYVEQKLPIIKATPWPCVFSPETCPLAVDLVSLVLAYSPSKRLRPLAACAHAFFDELRKSNLKLPNGRPIPNCTDFTLDELASDANLLPILCPQLLGTSSPREITTESKMDVSLCGTRGEITDVESAGDWAEAHRYRLFTGTFWEGRKFF
uniref:Protein kinase domain-containing protein n=1 Tax=Toxocara canis TaxID=6265 RepID=A0A183VCK1_TOXCA